MARYKKYRSAKELETAVVRYFDSISRMETVLEKYETGDVDKYGRAILSVKPAANSQGEVIQQRKYLIPPTLGGLCSALQITRTTWRRYCNPEECPQFSEITQWAGEQLLNWRENELLTREGKDLKGLVLDLQTNYGLGSKDTPLAASIPLSERAALLHQSGVDWGGEDDG